MQMVKKLLLVLVSFDWRLPSLSWHLGNQGIALQIMRISTKDVCSEKQIPLQMSTSMMVL